MNEWKTVVVRLVLVVCTNTTTPHQSVAFRIALRTCDAVLI